MCCHAACAKPLTAQRHKDGAASQKKRAFSQKGEGGSRPDSSTLCVQVPPKRAATCCIVVRRSVSLPFLPKEGGGVCLARSKCSWIGFQMPGQQKEVCPSLLSTFLRNGIGGEGGSGLCCCTDVQAAVGRRSVADHACQEFAGTE